MSRVIFLLLIAFARQAVALSADGSLDPSSFIPKIENGNFVNRYGQQKDLAECLRYVDCRHLVRQMPEGDFLDLVRLSFDQKLIRNEAGVGLLFARSAVESNFAEFKQLMSKLRDHSDLLDYSIGLAVERDESLGEFRKIYEEPDPIKRLEAVVENVDKLRSSLSLHDPEKGYLFERVLHDAVASGDPKLISISGELLSSFGRANYVINGLLLKVLYEYPEKLGEAIEGLDINRFTEYLCGEAHSKALGLDSDVGRCEKISSTESEKLKCFSSKPESSRNDYGPKSFENLSTLDKYRTFKKSLALFDSQQCSTEELDKIQAIESHLGGLESADQIRRLSQDSVSVFENYPSGGFYQFEMDRTKIFVNLKTNCKDNSYEYLISKILRDHFYASAGKKSVGSVVLDSVHGNSCGSIITLISPPGGIYYPDVFDRYYYPELKKIEPTRSQ
ncbi:MAG: hypothetical protein AB8E15_04450 [Bdellovibrionales bacterium]